MEMKCKLLEINISSLFFSEYKTRWFVAILEILKWFAGHQIRNVGVILLGNAKRLCSYLLVNYRCISGNISPMQFQSGS